MLKGIEFFGKSLLVLGALTFVAILAAVLYEVAPEVFAEFVKKHNSMSSMWFIAFLLLSPGLLIVALSKILQGHLKGIFSLKKGKRNSITFNAILGIITFCFSTMMFAFHILLVDDFFEIYQHDANADQIWLGFIMMFFFSYSAFKCSIRCFQDISLEIDEKKQLKGGVIA